MGGGKEWWFIRIKEKLSNYFLIKKQQIIQRLYWHFPFLFYLISFQSIKLIILIIIIFIIFIFKIIGDEKEILRIYGDTKYLTISLETSADKCGGLGNMMWRTASLYVIGKQLNRSIYFDGNYKCIYEYKEEFRDIFENNYKIFKIMRPKKQHVKLVSFAEKCCHYDSPDRLTDESAQLIKIWGNYLQSFKYLRNYKKQIRKFFTFSSQNKLKAYQFAQKLFKSQSIINKEFKICVHTRRGDFVELQQSTNKYFTEKATSYILNSVRKRYLNVSIILFGDDNNFLNHIEIADNVTIYTPTIRSRAVNLCFAINYCNSLLITAPTSTFAWWMGYLLPEGSPIFYYSCERSCRHISKKDFFPTEWLPLTLNFEGKIEVDDNPF